MPSETQNESRIAFKSWQSAFLVTLFELLERHKLRYCVLHSYEDLPEHIPSDLDIAVHPKDLSRLRDIISDLAMSGYAPIQYLNYAVNGHYIVFTCNQDPNKESIALDVISEHIRSGLPLMSGEELVSGRRLGDGIWLPAAKVELQYLLAKKILKKSIDPRQEARIETLLLELGVDCSNELTTRLFGTALAGILTDVSRRRELASMLPELRHRLIRNALKRSPFGTLLCTMREVVRSARRVLRRTGYFVVVLGPDGTGKSTLLRRLESGNLAFRRCMTLHWRPMLLGRRSHGTGPEGSPKRYSRGSSVVRLLFHWTDYWAGYWLLIRPAMVRSSLVLFDRYADDIEVNPARYGYSGPKWLLKLFRRLTPRPDLMVILDAPGHLVYERKGELSPVEIDVLRGHYMSLSNRCANSVIVDASRPAAAVYQQTHETIVDKLAERFNRQQTQWESR